MTPEEWFLQASAASDEADAPRLRALRARAAEQSLANGRRDARNQHFMGRLSNEAPAEMQRLAMRNLEEDAQLQRAEQRMREENRTGVAGAFGNYLRDTVAPRAAGALASIATLANPLDLLNIADVASPSEDPEPFPLSTEDVLRRWDPAILRRPEAEGARDATDFAVLLGTAPGMARGAAAGVRKLVGAAPLKNMISMEMASTRPSASLAQQLLVNRNLSRPRDESVKLSRTLLEDMLRNDAGLPTPSSIRDAQGAWQEGGGGQWNPAHILYYNEAPTREGAEAVARAAQQMGVGFGPVERPVGWRDYVRGPLEAISRKRNITRDPNAYYVPRAGGDAVIDLSRSIKQRGRTLDDVIMVDDPAGGGVFVRPTEWGNYADSGLRGLATDLPQLEKAPKARLLTDYAVGVE